MPDGRTQFRRALDDMPLIAIARGLPLGEAETIGDILFDVGFRLMEVPLNSPDALNSIERLAKRLGDRMVIGAGTVLSAAEAASACSAGARMIVAPNFNSQVAGAASSLGVAMIPGVMTPSEALTAIDAGVDALKLFPAEALPPAYLKALMAVLPPDAIVAPVGGIVPPVMEAYWLAGARAFGVGSALFKPGKLHEDIARDAEAFVRQATKLTRGPH